MNKALKRFLIFFSLAQAAYIWLYEFNIIIGMIYGFTEVHFSSRILFGLIGIAVFENSTSISALLIAVYVFFEHFYSISVILTLLGKRIHIWFISLFYLADCCFASEELIRGILLGFGMDYYAAVAALVSATLLSLCIFYLIWRFRMGRRSGDN